MQSAAELRLRRTRLSSFRNSTYRTSSLIVFSVLGRAFLQPHSVVLQANLVSQVSENGTIASCRKTILRR